MCKYVCEECDFRVFGSAKTPTSKCHLAVDLIEGSILENMHDVLAKADALAKGSEFPYDYLEDLISSKTSIDNFIVVSAKATIPTNDPYELFKKKERMKEKETNREKRNFSYLLFCFFCFSRLDKLLVKYRTFVNPNMMFYSIDLASKGLGVKAETEAANPNPKNVFISGFSDAILRFIAEKGNDNQLAYVEKIHVAKEVYGIQTNNRKRYQEEKVVQKVQVGSLHPQWKQLDTFNLEPGIFFLL